MNNNDNVFQQIVESHARCFRNDFIEYSRGIFQIHNTEDEKQKLMHPGEFGMYREEICRNFISFFLPQTFGISTGFVVSSKGTISHQCDIVIFDKTITPALQLPSMHRFFPIESVVAVGECKSQLDDSELKKALIKLSQIKQMKELASRAETINKQYCADKGLGFTFLICESVPEKSFTSKNIDEVYGDGKRYKHDLLLSLKNGLNLSTSDILTTPTVPSS